MPHPTSTLQLRSITTCVLLTRNINMPHPTPPHFKNNNPRGGGESAAHLKQHAKPFTAVKNTQLASPGQTLGWRPQNTLAFYGENVSGTLFHFPTMMQPIVRFDLGLGYFSPTDNAARTRQMDGERGYGYGYRTAKQSNNGPTKLFVVCVQAFRIDVGPSQHKGINRVEIMVRELK